MKQVNKNVLFLVSLFFFVVGYSCSPQKRLNRLLDRNPELKKDTVLTVHDTVITKSFNFDTLYNFKQSIDTVIINRKNVQVKVFHHNDTVYVKTNVKSDTIYKVISVPYSKINYTTDNQKNWTMFWAGMAVILFIIVVVWLFFKRNKP